MSYATLAHETPARPGPGRSIPTAWHTWMIAGLMTIILVLPCQAEFVGLGEAGNRSVFVVSNTEWSMNNSYIVDPAGTLSMAAGPGVTFNWSGGAGPYDGPVYYQTGGAVPPVSSLGGTPKPTAIATDLTQAVLDARAAAASAAAQTATGSITSITGSSPDITGNGGWNVIDVGSVNMSSGEVLIGGTANDYFLFRVSGNFNVGNANLLVTGGVTPDHVLWYFPNTSTIKSPNGSWDGTILALNSGVSLDNAYIRGAVIAGDDQNDNQDWKVTVVSGFRLTGDPFVPVPGAVLLGLLGLGAAGLKLRRFV